MTHFPIERFKDIRTPFYYYDTNLLSATLAAVREAAPEKEFCVHYAIKANTNPKILKLISDNGLGADCVSEGEIRAALDAGFVPEKIAFAGVGKSDVEIEFAIESGIGCFNASLCPSSS